ncbi:MULTISPECIES: hypothetical protein [unclassified Flavobacterium]|uniref:hypothetical protein n=1 Tax=unclassified Flavobacterium TaxID=196869 RepID=UPI00131C5EC8|nr:MULTISPECIES: hypothetical protein [unclassified Flavobacterium]
MEKQYFYNDFMWKSIYSNINTSVISKHFNLNDNYCKGFNSLLHDIAVLPNYTILNTETKLNLSMTYKSSHFEFLVNWKATKIKGTFIETVYNEIVHKKYYQNNYINWRNFCFEGFLNIFKLADNFEFTIDNQKNIVIKFLLLLDKIDEGKTYDILDNKFIVQLSKKSTKEVYNLGYSYLGTDNLKCIGILETIIDIFPYSGIIIGFAHKNLNNKKLSNEYLIKALDEISELSFLDEDFVAVISETIATNELNLGVVNNDTINLLFKTINSNQSHTALIKLSYLILSQKIKTLKSFALESVNIATEMCLNDNDEFSKAAGFHIICCVLLWNDKFKEAEKHHQYFLKENTKFTIDHKELIEGYFILALAKNNIEFIGNLILDFPYLVKIYGSYLDAWYFNKGNLFNKKETNSIVFYSRIIKNVEEEYC